MITKAELISAAMDGEAEIPDLDPDTEQFHDRIIWRRYHGIRSGLQGSADRSVCGEDFCRKISRAIDAEPTVLAPRRLGLPKKKVSRAISGIAIAASLAAVAILSVQLGGLNRQQDKPISVADLGQPIPADVRNVSGEQTRWHTDQPELESALNAFLVDHGEFSGKTGLNGVISYAKFVSYDSQAAAQ